MAAANRDPDRFPDPDRFDVERTDNRHVSFGWGVHFCFGAALARIESQLAFEEILRRLKNISLAQDQDRLTWKIESWAPGPYVIVVEFELPATSSSRAGNSLRLACVEATLSPCSGWNSFGDEVARS